MTSRLLIVNADDFGLEDSASCAIIDAHQAGSVTSTSFMANMPGAAAAASLAAANPALGVGLHFTLTAGKPVSSSGHVATLLDRNGEFVSRNKLVLRALRGSLAPNVVGTELAEQYRLACDLGINPTHVDSHQHIHSIPVIFDEIATFCRRHSLPLRMPWVPPAERAQGGWRRKLRRGLLRRFMERNRREWAGQLCWNDAITSIFDISVMPQQLDAKAYRQLLQSVEGQVVELMVHPVREAAAVSELVSIGEIGEREWRFLCEGTLPSIAAESGFQMATWKDFTDREVVQGKADV